MLWTLCYYAVNSNCYDMSSVIQTLFIVSKTIFDKYEMAFWTYAKHFCTMNVLKCCTKIMHDEKELSDGCIETRVKVLPLW